MAGQADTSGVNGIVVADLVHQRHDRILDAIPTGLALRQLGDQHKGGNIAKLALLQCNECRYMKMVTLENLRDCLRDESPEVVIDEATRAAAERSIKNMIAIK